MNKTLFFIALIFLITLVSCKQDPPQPSLRVPVSIEEAKKQKVTYFDRYAATTIALDQVNLISQVQGFLTGIFFKEGSHISKGEKLYEIDKQIYDANYNNAVANMKIAEGNLKQAQQDAERYEYLNKNDAVAKQLYDHAMITLDNAKNAYQSAIEVLKNTKTNLNYSTITSPLNGTIGFSNVKLGDFMSAGQTILATVSTDNPIGVDILVNEKQLPYFENLQSGIEKHIDSLFTIIMPDNSIYPCEGKISVIDRAVNAQTGTIKVRLVFPNPKYIIRPGMSCVVRVHNQELTPQIVVPNNAVVEEMGEYFLYVAKDSVISNSNEQPDKKGKALFAIQKKVQLGTVIGANIIIRNGIKEGDRIIIEGVQSLHNGSQISALDRKNPQQNGREGKNHGNENSNN